MKTKVFIGSAVAAALMGLGVLVGSIAGAGNVSAQTPTATATPSASKTDPATPSIWTLDGRGHGGMRGGGGHGGPGGFDRGIWGGATSDGATSAISNTTSVIALVKTDLDYANGKMDTATVQKWITQADALLDSAESANSSSQYGQAVAYASAARELALTARSQMAQELGADTLPSYSQLPQHRKDGASTTTTVTQAQASQIVAHTYDRLVVVEALVGNSTEAATYLADAQSAYQAAYDAYGAGNYSDAAASAKLAERLASIAHTVAKAATAPANSDTPVTVPAPNF